MDFFLNAKLNGALFALVYTLLAGEIVTAVCMQSCAASLLMYCAMCDSNVKYTLTFLINLNKPTEGA